MRELEDLFRPGKIERSLAVVEELRPIADRLGITVGSLFSMEKGLKAVGLPGEAATTIIFQMQKALGGSAIRNQCQ